MTHPLASGSAPSETDLREFAAAGLLNGSDGQARRSNVIELAELGSILASAEVFTDGDWVESKDQDPEGDVRLIQLADVGVGAFIDKSARFLTSATARRLHCTFLKPGDVLVARMPDPLGRACLFPRLPQPCVTVVDVCVIRPNPKEVDPAWLVHVLNAPASRHQVFGLASGTTRSRISRKNLQKIRIPFPSLSEQRRVADVLDRVDALRAKRRAVIARLNGLTQSIFLHMFGDPATNPKRWPTHRLGDVVAEVQIGPFGSLMHQSDYVDGGIPLVNPMHIVDGKIVVNPAQAVRPEKAQSLTRYWLREGDIVIGRRGEMGRCAVVGKAETGMICGSGSAVIRPDVAQARPTFLQALLSTSAIKALLERKALGVTMLNLNSAIIADVVVMIPPMRLQMAYEETVQTLEATIQAAVTSLAYLDALFASLQHRAFRGEL